MGWQTAAAVVSQVLFAVVSLVVARSVTPSEFAIWGFVAIVFNMRQVLRLGLGSALIYTRFDRPKELATASGAALAVTGLCSTALAIVLVVGAPLIASFFGLNQTQLTWALRVMAIALVFLTLEDIPLALIERAMRFRMRATIEIATTAAYVGLAFGLLGAGFGIWSLILGRAALGILRTGAFFIASPTRPVFRRSGFPFLPKLLRYGLIMNAAAMVSFGYENADTVLMAKIGGAAALGAYALAFTIVAILSQFFGETTLRVFFPLLARVRGDPATFRDAAGVLLQLTGLIAMPAAAALVLIAPTAVVDFFGAEWQPAVPFLRVLSLYGLARVVGLTIGVYMSAKGRPGVALQGSLLALLLPLMLVWPLTRMGAIGVAWAFTIGQCAFAGWLGYRAAELWRRPVVISLARVAIASGVASLVLFAAESSSLQLNNAFAEFGLMIAVYLALLAALERRALPGILVALRSRD